MLKQQSMVYVDRKINLFQWQTGILTLSLEFIKHNCGKKRRFLSFQTNKKPPNMTKPSKPQTINVSKVVPSLNEE